MIVKKISNPKKSSSKEVRISKLVAYIRRPELENAQEKCIYQGARGFITDERQSQTAEMIALSQEAVRSRDTVVHYVVSWHEGELPSSKQIEEVVDIFLDELGVKEHQVIYGMHADTDNNHLHIVINRVHPDTIKCIEINRGFDIEAAHRAIARVEHVQGWRREENGRYRVKDNGEIIKEQTGPDRQREIHHKKRDMERRTGAKSAERIARKEGAGIILKAQSWSELHAGLAKSGMRYERTGSGATLFVGSAGVKASAAHREASIIKLQKRLGPYQPPEQSLQVVKRAPEPMKPGQLLWREYIEGRESHYAAKEAERVRLSKVHEQERMQLSVRHRQQRDELFSGKWDGKGLALNALRSITAAEQAQEKLTLRDRQRKEREEFRKKYPPYPDYDQWRQMVLDTEGARPWPENGQALCRIIGDREEPPTPGDIRLFVGEVVGAQVHYCRRGSVRLIDDVSFVDRGRTIDVQEWKAEDATLAALQLAAQKWGSFKVQGNDVYKAMCARLAAQHGLRITNAELQEAILQERKSAENNRETKSHYVTEVKAMSR